MLFTSYGFIGFLLAVFVLYYLIPKKMQWPFLLIASYIFYFIADPRYLIFIAITTVTTFYGAKVISDKKVAFDGWFKEHKKEYEKEERKALKAKEHSVEKKIFLACLLFNLGILAVTKYTNFTIANINSLLAAFGRADGISFVDLIIPMGISFYTFQSMGYLIDVYNGKHEAQDNLFKFALFVSFFPQLVQGPISRYHDLSQTLYAEHSFNWKTVSFGLERILWGFFKKLVIADRILVAVQAIIADTDTYNGFYAFAGAMFYALELYADFTGGIDITIGVAETMGIKVTENFIRPYFSKNIKEYWNRWHITMGTWFTDYIFYPISASQFMMKLSKKSRARLGNNLGKRVPVYLSSFIVWFTTGIWHGASWNFIVWGLGNFVVIMISQELEPFYRWFHSKVHVQGTFGWRLFQVVRTVLIMSSLRMFDCYRDVPLTFKMFGSIFSQSSLSQLNAEAFIGMGLTGFDYLVVFIGMLILVTVSLIQRSGCVREKIYGLAAPVRFIIWYGLFMATLVFGAYGIGYSASQFIYNQF
ncbi:MBOAT family O-acyltransferase [Pseudobutyrivibrio ruminis]|uniref:D-alanyl-lipoteichoic acid acyltransferase DltB, MBOAT superfamily n=1 Tax=Pseudobutyrivibrio ruminis DSM 9787 TaxID=1123011 RepID=A0A285RQ73_9FIRM|nr:MBOAT family O-acyltransferase [Pseudobutyrivibrio ruminis]SOB96200.1 D-alanyl-lipoteichoic acid acyltransferase DltB, MBOAT superfamily [Pseudobutyrivibrio ruminis DSM 9787]